MPDISSGCYVIDDSFDLIDINETAAKIYPQLELGKKCYECLMGLDAPCGPCPVVNGVKGPHVYEDPIRGIAETVDAVDIALPGLGLCHELVFSTVGSYASYAATLPSTADDLQDLALVRAMMVDLQDVYTVHLADESVIMYRHDSKPVKSGQLHRSHRSYTEGTERYIEKYVVEDDRAKMREQCDLRHVTAELRSAESIVVHYRVSLQGEVHYYYRKLVRVGEADSFEDLVVGVGCEDETMRTRLLQQKLERDLTEVEYDQIAGLYTREAFSIHGQELLDRYPQEKFDLCVMKIEEPDVIIRQYGRPTYERLIALVGRLLREYDDEHTCLTYMGGGTFASYTLNEPRETHNAKVLAFRDRIMAESEIKNISMKWSIYIDAERGSTVETTLRKTQYALSMLRTGTDDDLIEFDQTVIDRMDREDAIRRGFKDALANGEFVAWFQPKYSARTKQIVGAEALVRWIRPDGGMVSPGEFIPVLESFGKIGDLDEEIFRQACRLQAELRERGIRPVPISVNLSRASIFTRDIALSYGQIAAEERVDPRLVPIEITESAAIRAVSIRRFADELIDRGFVLHMDDFGSGYSSLASLHMIPFESIKLDKTLVDLIGGEHGEGLLRHTIAYAKESGKTVVAEGVETVEQYVSLKVLGCDEIQGYYFSKPVTRERLIELLAER